VGFELKAGTAVGVAAGLGSGTKAGAPAFGIGRLGVGWPPSMLNAVLAWRLRVRNGTHRELIPAGGSSPGLLSPSLDPSALLCRITPNSAP